MPTFNSVNVTDLGGGNWQVDYSYTNDNGITKEETKSFTSGAEGLEWITEIQANFDAKRQNIQDKLDQMTNYQNLVTFYQAAIDGIQAEIDANTP